MFSQIGPLEIVLVLAIALIVLGPKRLPDAGRSVGRGIRNFKAAVTSDHDEDDNPKTIQAPKSPPTS
ncbi:MAG TPA: twin-arginine translocase TatA/TatE family subunit [Solirubrobacteraceae bacterium]|jgi:sec-independent protein translocase protein TatA|nr:twin-arginine translocase TatA/TatE family subunit [Solirubrobacteraceae bacterium]